MQSNQYQNLQEYLRKLGSCAVAFSGGLDSSFLLTAAKEALGENLVALTVDSPYIPEFEIVEAKELTAELEVEHQVIVLDFPENIRMNPDDRCYLCKKQIFSRLLEAKNQLGFNALADGTNASDKGDYRPGMKALKELGIRSPFLELDISKADIRRLAKERGCSFWEKPAYACLLSRIPHNTEITEAELKRIEAGEEALHKMAFLSVRIRSHGDLARIEVPPEERHRFFDERLLDTVSETLKAIGYRYVCIDAVGYKTGSMNPKNS